MLKRERGRPSSLGSSQARAFTATTIPGGKDTWSALPWEYFKAGHSLLEEALAPFADDLSRCIEALGDLIVAQSARGIQHDLRSDHVAIRCRISASGRLEHGLILGPESNVERALSRHSTLSEERVPLWSFDVYRKYVSVFMELRT